MPSRWPPDALPSPTASLLSIASGKGLLAASGPDSVILASTESVRQAFYADSEEDIKPFKPQQTLQLGTRLSQVVFSRDENFLVLSAEQGGGLRVYDVQALVQGGTQPAFEISTEGTSLRALVPNPFPDAAELFAVVTVNGDLLIANLKTRNFHNGPNGKVMKSGVSCVSWSLKGKQLVAGLGDGSCCQMTPEGEVKAQISRPPTLTGNEHGKFPQRSKERVPSNANSFCNILDRDKFDHHCSYSATNRQ